MHSDCIVIGAGYSGLAAAALLVKQGYGVTLLEKHTAIGGCASFFRRKQFTFDVGATTLSGLQAHQPLGALFMELGISPNLLHVDPGMVIHLDGKKIIRHADLQKWIAEAEHQFGKKGQRAFWEEVHSIDKAIWKLMHRNPEFPPASISDILALASRPDNLLALPLLRDLFRPMDVLLEKHKLHTNTVFKKFINEQLLISTQSFSDTAPIVTGAMGLAYPAETFYPIGGITKPAQLLVEYIRNNGGNVILKEHVQHIDILANENFEIRTAKDSVYSSRYLFNSIPLWNTPELSPKNPIGESSKKYSETFTNAWGAFTVYCAVKTEFSPESPYAQIHTSTRIPLCEGDSFFVTWSHPSDTVKAPDQWRTITISTHTNADQWWKMSEEEYNQSKKATLDFIISELLQTYPELSNAEFKFVDAGTPKTFAHYTGRHKGFVGGLPHSIDLGFFALPKNKTSIPNYFSIGDTAFPGQGTPAVVMSAMNAIKKM